MNPSQIEIEIEELILDGVSVDSARQLQAALTARLAQLVTAQPLAGLESGGAVSRIDGGTLQLTPGESSGDLGSSIADAVYRSLGGKA